MTSGAATGSARPRALAWLREPVSLRVPGMRAAQRAVRRLVRTPFLLLALVALLFFVPVLANPGFFSHDEWQKADDVQRHGLLDYLRRYTAITPGSHFGVPVRPVSFAMQGFVAPFMAGSPFVVHLCDVLMHLAAGWLSYLLLYGYSRRRDFALVAALVFLVSPLAVPSVVWPAALMDRLYVLWGLAGMLALERYLAGAGVRWLLLSAAAVALAMGSKETAMLLPGALLVRAAWESGRLRDPRTWIALAAWTLPIALFMLVRLPALLATLRGAGGASYSFSTALIPDGLALYLAFPLMTELDEATRWVPVMTWGKVEPLVLHAGLVAALGWRFGLRAVLAYAALYLLFLLPVLGIPTRGGHYLYGSGLAFSVAVAALLVLPAGKAAWLARAVAGVVLLVAVQHSWAIQGFAYDLGRCMELAGATTEDEWLRSGRPATVWITAEPGAPTRVLNLFTARDQIGAHHPVRLLVLTKPAGVPADATQFQLTRSCTVRRVGH